jgi:hypothetical protein
MKMRIFIIITGLLSAGLANAQQDYPRDLTLSWVNASTYIDGTLIETGDLTGIRLECFRHDDTITPVMNATVPASGEGQAQTEVFTGAIAKPGTYTCYGYSVVIGGIESDPSVPASEKFVGKPNPIVFQ